MSSKLDRPACLHIPPLLEGNTETIAWAEVNEADIYELDCSFDESFPNADMGKTWGDIHDRGEPWSDIAALSWRELQSLPAQGSAWYAAQSENLSWTDLESRGLTWGEFHSQAPKYTIYTGTGTAFDIPSRDSTWDNLTALSLEWQEIHETSTAWQGLPRGSTWHNLNAHRLQWQEVQEVLLSWQDLPQSGAGNVNHRSYTAQLPLGKKTASYRARALANTGDVSDHITSAEIAIAPLFYRQSSLRMNVVKGNEYILLLHTRDIDRLSEVVFTLDYSPFFLQLNKDAPHLSHGMQLENIGHTPPECLFARDGRVKFRWSSEINGDAKLNRPVILFEAKALQTGSTQVKIY